MRMPLLSYFIVMSFVLTAALIFVSSQMEPQPPPIATSQIVGLGKSYTPEREASPYPTSATNFAAPHEVPTDALARADEGESSKPARRAKAREKPRPDDDRHTQPAAWAHTGQNPIDAMMAIH